MKKFLLFLLLAAMTHVASFGQTNIANYTFSTVTGATYTPITGGTVFITGSYDNSVSAAITMGGTFSFGGTAMTTCYISTNGFITFGAAPTTTNYTPMSLLETTTGAIAPFAQDAGSSTATGATPEIRYQDLGTEFVVQYKDHANYFNRSTERLNFQIRLTYLTGAINIIYGTCTNPGTTSTSGTTPQVGIRGNSVTYSTNVSNLYALNVPAATTCNWASAVTGFSNASTLLFSGTTNVNVNIPAGLTYTWTPSTQAPVRTFTAPTSITLDGATIAWTAPTGATQYNVQYRIPGTCTWTNWSGNPVMTTSVTLSGLASSTTYQVRVQASNGTVNSIYSHIPSTTGTGDGYSATGTFTTLAPPCVAPTSLAATATAATPTLSTIAVSFTAAPPTTPTGYVVVRTAVNTQPTLVTGTTYTVGSNAVGYIEYVGTSASSWTSSGLTPNTTYYYWVFSYNNTACSGGPMYSTSSTTCNNTTLACSTFLSTIQINGATAVPGTSYPTLTAAIFELSSCGITQPTILELTSAYVATAETFPIAVTYVPGSSATNTITIRPATGVTGVSISSANTTATFDINGGRYYIIDGQPGGTGGVKQLTISNTSTATGGTAVRFINEASNNTIKYATLNALYPSATSGVVLFSTTTGANGNDNNLITYCDIDGGAAATASPTLVAINGIYSAGSTTSLLTYNNSITISNCNIFNFFNGASSTAGILTAAGTSDWTIQNNKIYQTAARQFTSTALTYYGIAITNSGANNMMVSGNTIGFATSAGTGVTNITGSSNMVFGISIFPGTTTVSTVQNNTVTAITQTSSRASTALGAAPFYGIRVGASGLLNITGNTIGSLDNSTAISVSATSTTSLTVPCAGIYSAATAAQTISGNNFGSITVGTGGSGTKVGFVGIQLNQTTGITATVSGNTIGGTTAASGISVAATGGQAIGIQTLAGISTINGNNIIRNLIHTGLNIGTSGSASVIGISMGSVDNGQTVSQNTIHSLVNNSAGAVTVTGIYSTGTTLNTNTVARNLIYNLAVNSATGIVNGIQSNGGYTNYQNNMIRLGYNVDGTAMTVAAAISGINQSLGTDNFYYNSVYIGGTSVVSAAINTYAFNSTQTVNARIFKNNIFVNARSNTSGTGKHYAVRVGGSGVNPSGLTINYNDYFVSGTGGVFGYFNGADVATLAAWKTAVGQDANSLNVDPPFTDPTVSPAFNLRITTGATPNTLESAGTAISDIAYDFDNDVRPGPVPSLNGGGFSPDLGADEFDGYNAGTCTGTPAAGGTAACSVVNTCGGTNGTFTLTGATTGIGIQYQWQSSPTGTSTWTNVAGAISQVATFAVLTGIYDYQCLVKCGASGLSVASTLVTVEGLQCQFNVTRSTGITYSSIMTTGTTYASWYGTSGDDNYTGDVSLAGTTFKYAGSTVTGFYASTNGFLSLNTALHLSSYTNDLTITSITKVLAPFWDDLVVKGQAFANVNTSMRYKINGTLGSGTADIVIEWADMERFNFGAPNINFQVILHESNNSIEFNYGNMQLWDGSANIGDGTLYSYSIGLNGANPAGTALADRMILQRENTSYFAVTNQTTLAIAPECYSRLTFMPNTYTGTDPGIPGIPVNDEPAGAIAVSVNSAPCTSVCNRIYTSKNATASAGITVCNAVTPGTPDDDVWFKFVTTAATDYRFDVTPSLNYDAVVQVFDNTFANVVCVNDYGTGLSESFTKTKLIPGGATYYVRVYHAGATYGSSTGEFALCISEVILPPTNNECAGATVLTVKPSCTPTASELPATLAATASAGIPVCDATTPGVPDDDVWYSFTTNSTAAVPYTITVAGSGSYNAVLQLLSGTCGALTAVNCQNATGNGGTETYTTTTLTPSTTYYVRVYHSGIGAANGTFSVCVYAAPPACVTGTVPANGTSVSATGTTLSWTASPSANTYDVYLDSFTPPTTKVSADQVGTTYITGILDALTTYYWRVTAKNPAGGDNACSIQDFNTNPPPCIPTPTAPVIGSSTCASATATTLSWPVSLGATGYDVYFDAGSGPATTLASANQAGLTYSAGVLGGGTYAWRIEPKNTNGTTTGCSNWTFTVIAPPADPGNPTSNSPQCGNVTLTRTGTPPAGETWYWQTSSTGTTIAPGVNDGATYIVSTSGTYYIRSQNNTTLCWNTKAGSVAVASASTAPSAAITPVPADALATVCYMGTGAVSSISWGAVTGADSYDVYFGAGSLPGTVTANVATNSYSTGTLAANTTYHWKVVPKNACGEPGAPSTWTFTTLLTPCVCIPTSSCSGGDQITNVTFAGINNNSTCVGTGGYNDFTGGTPATVSKTITYSFSGTVTNGGTEYLAIWIDFNQNAVFEASEYFAIGSGPGGTFTNSSILIPATATEGATKMRVRLRYNTSLTGTDACTSYTYGETEDYLVNIGPVPTCLAPTVLPATAVGATTATISWTAPSPAPVNGYQYEVRSSGAAGSGSTGLAASGTTTGLSVIISTGLVSSTTYYTYVRSNCDALGYSDWAAGLPFGTTCQAVSSLDEGFNGTTFAPLCWSLTNAGTGNSWTRGTTSTFEGLGVMNYIYSSAAAANAWAFTPELSLTSGTTYVISFYQKVAGLDYPEKLKVTIGGAPTVVAQTNTLWDNDGGTDLINETYIQRIIEYVAPTTGSYYVAFNCYSDADMWNLYVDKVLIMAKPPIDLALTSFTQTSGLNAPISAGSDPYTVTLDKQTLINGLQHYTAFTGGGNTEHSSNVNNTVTLANGTANPDNSDFPGTPIHLSAEITNLGTNPSGYTLDWSVGGVAQTTYTGPAPIPAPGSDVALLTYNPTARGTFLTNGTVNATGDAVLSNNSNSIRLRVYPDVFTRTTYDNGTSVVATYAGWGSTTPMKAGVRYTATENTKLAGVDFIFRTETVTTGQIFVQVRAAGATTTAPGEVLYTKMFNTTDYLPSGDAGQYVTFPFGDDAPVIASGSDYWITIKAPAGILFPGGAQSTGITAGHSFYEGSVDTTAWSSLVLTSVEYAWIMRAVNVAVALPTVTTDAITLPTSTGGTSGGNVTSDGGSGVTARGVCWGTTAHPVPGTGNYTTNGTGTGTFVSLITGLTTGTHYFIRAYATNIQGTGYGSDVEYTPASATKTLNLTVFLEGLYNSGLGAMVKAQGCDDGETPYDVFSGTIADTISVLLAETADPWTTVYQAHALPINTDGTIVLNAIPAAFSGDYYIIIRHRNHVETWSQIVSFSESVITYNFTDGISKAWGDNMKQIGTVFCIYTGDANHDQYVDGFDLADVFNLNQISSYGYQVGDMNGDGFIDGFDLALVFNNNQISAGMDTPIAPLDSYRAKNKWNKKRN